MNARDHSGMSGQPRQETMFPSTQSGASTTVAPAFSMSPCSGGNAAVLRPAQQPVDGRHLRAVADRADRQVLLEEVLRDPAHVGVEADVLGRAAARDDERDVLGRIDLGERDVDRQLAAVLLGVGVRVRVEVVDDELDLARA